MLGRCWTWRTRSTRAWSGHAPSRSRSYTGLSPRCLGTSPCHVALSRALEITLIYRPFAATPPPAFSFRPFVLFAHTHAPGALSFPHSLPCLPPAACPPLPPRPLPASCRARRMALPLLEDSPLKTHSSQHSGPVCSYALYCRSSNCWCRHIGTEHQSAHCPAFTSSRDLVT